MNDILSFFLSAIDLLPYLIISSIIPGIFILNQAAKQRSIIKTLPSIVIASVCYSILIYQIASDREILIMFMLWQLAISVCIIEFILCMFMGYNTWNQSFDDLTISSQNLSIVKQILFAIPVSIFSILSGHNINIIDKGLSEYFWWKRLLSSESTDISVYLETIAIFIPIFIIWIWFFSLAIVSYNIRKLNKSSTILTVINKIAAVIILYIALMSFKEIITLDYW